MDFWQKTITDAVSHRHRLHKIPEIAWHETQTADYVRTVLNALNISWRSCTDTGTVAIINPGQARNIALRADIDALAIQELNSVSYQSVHSGFMHACGHDGHTATLLAVAKWLKHCEAILPHTVTLLFQPAEEGGHGAREMIAAGALDGVDEIFGWHNWPALPFPRLFCPDHLVMCGNGVFSILVSGVGGHSSQPELCRDPVLAASAIHLALQNIISRRLPPQSPAVLSVTAITAEGGLTTTPAEARLSGSIRVPDEATRNIIAALMVEVSQHTAMAYGTQCEVTIEPRYQATINHPESAAKVRELWQTQNGNDGLIPVSMPAIMASEDFSYYLRELPGAFALIGANEGDTPLPSCHSAHFDFNDKLISKVAKLFCALVGAPDPN